MEQNLAREIKTLRADIKKDFRSEMKEFKQSLETITKEIGHVSSRVQKLEDRTDSMEEMVRDIKTNQDSDRERFLDLKALDDQRMRQNCLKLRGLKEARGENLYDRLIPALAEYMNISVQELSWSTDKIYRINSKIARDKDLPRDIVLYFLRQNVKEQLLLNSYQEKLIIEDCEIKIYKDVPKRILQKRERYKFLTKYLIRYNVMYKWEKLEGISVFFKQRWIKLNSTFKAKEFWKRHGKEIESNKKMDKEDSEDGRSEELKKEEDHLKETDDKEIQELSDSDDKEGEEEEGSEPSEPDEDEGTDERLEEQPGKTIDLEASSEEIKSKPRRKRKKTKAK